jgi:hypothetical protein
MSTNFYFKSLRFSNYRGLKDLNIPSLHRINLIGGFNGTGKSTVLEGIFTILDRRGLLAVPRTFITRKINLLGLRSLYLLFNGLDYDKPIEISATTKEGNLTLSMSISSVPEGIPIQLPFQQSVAVSQQQTKSDATGLHIETKINGKIEDASFVLPMNDIEHSINHNAYKVGNRTIPIGVLITAVNRNSPPDDAARFSNIVRDNRLNDLLHAVSIIRPAITNIQLLQEGASAVLYAQLDSGALYPFSMLGDGLQTLLSISLAIMSTKDGVVLLDEFDSAIHYSVLSAVWGEIANLADKYNCQIIAVTHSLECIKAAFEGMKKNSRLQDLQYIRLERDDTNVSAVSYNNDELNVSLNSEWEIR